MKFLFLKILFIFIFCTQYSYAKDYYKKKLIDTHLKYEEIKKENLIANENLKKLELELEEINSENIKLNNRQFFQITPLVIVIFFSSIIILISINFYLYTLFRSKWTKIDENKLVTFPKEAVDTMHTFLTAHETFIEETNKYLESIKSDLANEISDLNSKIGNLAEQQSNIRQLAEERGDELKRYKEGYDYSNLKSLILGIIDNIKNIEKYLSNEEIIKSPLSRYLEATKDKLELLLQSNGVEEYIPKTGKLVSDVDGCKAVDTKNTEDDNLINVIKEIKQKGYMITIDNENYKIVKDAEVIVYSKGETYDK